MPKFVLQGDNVTTGSNTFQGATTLSGTNTLSGATTISGTLSTTGLTKTSNPVFTLTNTDIDAQNGTPTIAQLLGGQITHTSVTGAGTLTVPTGTNMSGGISGVAVGSAFNWLYYNDGTQTVTITDASGHTLVGGTAAVTTGKHMTVTSVCTGTNTWVSYLTTLM